MINYISYGNIFQIKVLNYAHGCNCDGIMGKGIAVQFKKKFPEMFINYRQLCLDNKFKLGDVYEYNYGIGTVYNLGTQISWRSKAEIKAIELSLNNMLSSALEKKITDIALPKIGCGLGRLNWDEVKNVMEQTAFKFPTVNLFVVENYKE